MNHKINTYCHKRNTEPLSHIQHHTILKAFLIFLDKLYEETEYKDGSQTQAEEKSPMQMFLLSTIQIPHQQTDAEISQRLVKLCWMTGVHIYPFEHKSPRHIRGKTYNFRIHQIGNTDTSCCQRSSQCDDVCHIQEVHLRLPAIQNQCYNQSQRTAMACQPCITDKLPSSIGQKAYGKYYLCQMLREISPVVKQTVPQTCSNKNTYHTIYKQTIEVVLRQTSCLEYSSCYYKRSCQSNHPEQAIPTKPETQYLENHRVGIPMNLC